MNTEQPAGGFLRHRGLILTAAGGAVVEDGLLVLLAPSARSVAPQATAVPSLAAYHDLRWLFAGSESWLWFAVIIVAVLAARAALDVLLLRLAWPAGVPAPRGRRALASCAALTLVAWLMLLPAATLAFGVAVLPFSWPFLAAFPLMLVMVAALSHGGVVRSWWRRLPPARAVGWLLVSFATATAAGAVINRLPAGPGLAVAAAAGLVNARAWYGLACLAARVQPRALASVPARVVLGLPFAPLSGLAVLAVLVVVARLLLTGAIVLPATQNPTAASLAQATLKSSASLSGGASAAKSAAAASSAVTSSAVLVVAGFGSSCCDAANSLRAVMPGAPLVRQFSYTGLDAKGQPVPSGVAATDISLPRLGDKIAAQVLALHAKTGRKVAIVAESEGTLGVYAMLARHPGLPVSSIGLLSPIVSPDQLGDPATADTSVSGDALDELDHLIGRISPYGPAGAQSLLSSVGRVGARYFDHVVAEAASGTGSLRWLTIVPLADAVTLPDCSLPADVIVVPAFHGGLLGDPAVLPMISRFLAGRVVTQSDGSMREAAEMITGAAAAWRLPDLSASCP